MFSYNTKNIRPRVDYELLRFKIKSLLLSQKVNFLVCLFLFFRLKFFWHLQKKLLIKFYNLLHRNKEIACDFRIKHVLTTKRYIIVIIKSLSNEKLATNSINTFRINNSNF